MDKFNVLWANLYIKKGTNFPFRLAENFSLEIIPELIQRDAELVIRHELNAIMNMTFRVRAKMGSHIRHFPNRIYYTIRVYSTPSLKIKSHVDL